ncbi:MAG: ABC transporter ATP-binding protein [Chloroflexi bacterium HGW-Chloroflexi-10]|nr:MAG: ABC transporter ATP-binding protein [Chloroflexi bacterium HGW-Chloroflexi-10]
MSDYAVQAHQLVKKFRQKTAKLNGEKSFNRPFWKKAPQTFFTAVEGIDLKINKGEIFGLLGPNGAGKSTTIRMLCTLLEPTSGSATVNGFDINKQATQVRQSLGTVLAGERSIYWKLTGRENLLYFAALYHIPARTAKQRANELIEMMGLSERADETVEKYSTGMKQRIAISKALLARPPILLFDEPTLGLDPQAARMVRELVLKLKEQGHTILLTTHYMEEADQLSDRIGIIDTGKIIALDTPTRLKELIQQKEVVRMEISGWYPELEGKLRTIPAVENMVIKTNENNSFQEVNLQTENSRTLIPQILEQINVNGTQLVNMNILKPSLEDVFIHLTGKALRD